MGTAQQKFSNQWASLVFGALVIFVVGVNQGYNSGLYLLKTIAVLVGLATGLYLGRWKKPPYTNSDLLGAICVWFCLGTLVGVIAGIVSYTEIKSFAISSIFLPFLVIVFVSDEEYNADLYLTSSFVPVPLFKKIKMNWTYLIIEGIVLYCGYGYIAISHANQSHETIIWGLLIGVILSIVVFFRWKNAVKQAPDHKFSLEWLIESSIIPRIRR